ncbi:Crp/Fnr family transcriptional regulator [Sphingomicrobium aestuariivivum]|uniref:Crp/Fnr family transcriptional regulator n=1 Tax=Sphingomicrobium aestuariivivum TaxID=1582356 RepID=UPI001FD6DFD8|nr:Crp/Fnr family transcriptional regulator [Sphingomicrobium aestuariivivum]MCJ8191104.1 Crp/Fnr family transcriptional regulator [Sphingomicrobium aestuariivivum]
MKLQCETCPVRDSAACASLSIEERDELARIGAHRNLKRGEVLFHAGDEADVCATLNSGLLKISHLDAEGNERILSLVHPAGFVGEMFAPVENHDIVALTDSRLCLFDRREYEKAIERFPALARALLRRSAADLFEARAQIALDAKKGAGAKIANLLRSLARAASSSPCHSAGEFDLPLTRGEMAGLLGLTIETVSRQLTKMEKQGIIARSGTRGIRIADPARLADLAE